MSHYHAVVWIDHHQARVYHFNDEDIETLRVLPKNPHAHLHHHRGSDTDGHAAEDQHYYHQVAATIADAGEVLIVGPGLAKGELVKHLESHDPAWREKVVGIETVDHPTDKEVVAHARKYFRTADRMRPQRG